MSTNTRALVTRWNEEVWNQRKDATIDAMMHPDCTMEVEGMDGQQSVAQFKAYRHAFLFAVPDFHVAELAVTADGDAAVLKWRVTGTHLGPGLGIPPSGRAVRITGMSHFEFRDGRIVRGFDCWNRGEFIASLMLVRMDDLRSAAGLTEREAQVALLMAERLTYREIATQLRIAGSTARRHCERVLTKLRISRKQDVAVAIGRVPASVLDRHGSDLLSTTT